MSAPARRPCETGRRLRNAIVEVDEDSSASFLMFGRTKRPPAQSYAIRRALLEHADDCFECSTAIGDNGL